MNYIVMDLEWNQTPNGKGTEKKGLPFEIIEIGAVKLNEKFEVVGQFSELIRPQVYKKMHRITKSIIHMDIEDLKNCRTFPQVASRFLKWCGKDYSFCTWGSMDLTELQRNLKYYRMNPGWKVPFYYYDLQKVYSMQYENDGGMKSLETAIDHLGIRKDSPFHRASQDADYTVRVLEKLDKQLLLKHPSIDYYLNPKSRAEEVSRVFEGYSEDISMEFANKEHAMKDKKLRQTVCYHCGKKMHKKIRWFSWNSSSYLCLAECPKHGMMSGKIRIKHTDEGRVFAIKTIQEAGEKDRKDMVERREYLRKKRREKRQKQSMAE